jgi:hypothetical protein
MHKISLIITAILLLPVLSAAQPGHQRGRAAFERVEAEKVAFYTRSMELTPGEAREFWPVYDSFQERRNMLVRERHTISASFTRGREQLTSNEATELADRYIELQVKEADLAREYHDRFKAILPPAKVMRLYQAENEFKMQLLRRVRGGGHGRESGGPGRPER